MGPGLGRVLEGWRWDTDSIAFTMLGETLDVGRMVTRWLIAVLTRRRQCLEDDPKHGTRFYIAVKTVREGGVAVKLPRSSTHHHVRICVACSSIALHCSSHFWFGSLHACSSSCTPRSRLGNARLPLRMKGCCSVSTIEIARGPDKALLTARAYSITRPQLRPLRVDGQLHLQEAEAIECTSKSLTLQYR